MLVARKDAVLLSKGYGQSNRAHSVLNTPATSFEVSGVQGSLSMLGALWLEEQGKLPDQAPICRYLAHCPAAWQPITVHMTLDGTSGLLGFATDTPGRTIAQSLKIMQSEPLTHAPGATVDYENGEVLVLSLIAEQVSGQPWGSFIHHAFLEPAGMTHSGQLTPATAPHTLTQYFSGTTHNGKAVGESGSFFSMYATAEDVYAYDNALFGGKLVSQRSLSRLFTPRVTDPNAPAGFTQARYGYWWGSAQPAGRQAVYTVRGTTANLRFTQDGITIVVLSNDDQNDVGDIALHLSALVFGQQPAAATPIAAASFPPALLGTYSRIFQNADRVAAGDSSLTDWVGGTITITISKDSVHFALLDNKPEDSVDEYYAATPTGGLTMGGYTPVNRNSFCSENPHRDPPPGTYRWANQGKVLTITRTAVDPCLDRGAIMPGQWMRVG